MKGDRLDKENSVGVLTERLDEYDKVTNDEEYNFLDVPEFNVENFDGDSICGSIKLGDSDDDILETSSLRTKVSEHLKPNIGLVILAAAYLFNSLMVVSTKLLVTDPSKPNDERIKPLQILLVRMIITYLGTLAYMYINRAIIPHVPFGPPGVRKWLLLRGTVGFFGVFGMYFSLMYLTISDAYIITFLSPSVTIILAWVILREQLTRFEVYGSLISLSGVLLIVRPAFLFGEREIIEDNSGSYSSNPRERMIATLVGLLGVLGASSVYIIIRYIGKRAHAIMSVSYFSLVTTIVSFFGIVLIPSMKFQIPSTLKEWLLFAILGFCGFFFQLLLTMGIQKERAGRGSLMQYTQISYALFWDILLWDSWPNVWSWCGMILIVGSTLCVFAWKQSMNRNETVRNNENTEEARLDQELQETVELQNYSD